MNSSIIGAVAASLSVPIIFSVIKKLNPYKEVQKNDVSFADLQAKYTKWEAFSLLPVFSFTIIGTFITYKIFIYFANEYILSLDPYVYLFTSQYQIALLLPSMFLGIFESALPTTALYKLLLREKYYEYDLYIKLKSGIDFNQLLPIGILSIIICIISSVLYVNTYTKIQKDKIEVNNFFGLNEIEHKYADIIKMESYYESDNKGNIANKLTYKIYFSDGYIWTNIQSLRDPGESDWLIVNLINNTKDIEMKYIGVKRRRT